MLGALGAWGKIAGRPAIQRAVDVYTTVFRGVPELLVIYLIYFGGSQALTSVGHLVGQSGFIGLNGFLAGALAVGVIAGAYLTEAIRGGFLAIPRGEMEAGRAVGMGHALLFRRIAGAAHAALRPADHGQCLAAGAQGFRADLGHRAG